MKVLHVLFGFPPDAPGGTELYVQSLCREMHGLGVHAVVAAPAARDARYRLQDLEVRRFATAESGVGLDELYGSGDAAAAEGFARILDEERPDVVHQHALTAACSGRLIRAAKARGLPVLFTYHTATVSCQRGTLLEWGRHACDGRVSVSRCTPCTLHGLGLDGTTSALLARMPEAAGDLLGRAGLGGGAWTALRMRSLMRRRVDQLRQVLADVDVFICVNPWVKALLQGNGVADAKLVSCTHGVAGRPLQSRVTARRSSDPLRVAHLGRLDPWKGTKILVQAVRALPDVWLSLDVFGVVQNDADRARLEELQGLAASDARIRFLPAIESPDVVSTLSGYDLVAVPSQGIETGPLVVLEAFAAGVPVLGSAIGGIADKVTHGTNGWLVKPHNTADAWRTALSKCASDGYLLTRMRSGVKPPRSMTDVAYEMRDVYERATASPRTAEAGAPRRPRPVALRAPGVVS